MPAENPARLVPRADENEDAMIRQMVQSEIEKESHAFFATARVWDDGIIERDTRTVLGLTLSAVHSNVIQGTTRYACRTGERGLAGAAHGRIRVG
jgi:acetyl-CoA carboxylase carboxyltransferase component